MLQKYIFGVFGVLRKNRADNFALILPKCAPNGLKILAKFWTNLSRGSGVIVEKLKCLKNEKIFNPTHIEADS